MIFFSFLFHFTPRAATADFAAKQTEQHARHSAALGSVGVWSEYGVEDVRNAFWESYNGGKESAKRATMFDVLFSSFRSRDGGLVEILVSIVFSLLINFTLGFVFALFGFAFKLYSLIVAYQASLVSFVPSVDGSEPVLSKICVTTLRSFDHNPKVLLSDCL